MDPGSDSEEEEVVEGKTAILKLDDWITFRVDPEAAKLALMLRFKWHALLMKRLRAPNKPPIQVLKVFLIIPFFSFSYSRVIFNNFLVYFLVYIDVNVNNVFTQTFLKNSGAGS